MIITKIGEVQPKDYSKIKILVENEIVKPMSINKLSDSEYMLEYWNSNLNRISTKLLNDNDIVHLHR